MAAVARDARRETPLPLLKFIFLHLNTQRAKGRSPKHMLWFWNCVSDSILGEVQQYLSISSWFSKHSPRTPTLPCSLFIYERVKKLSALPHRHVIPRQLFECMDSTVLALGAHFASPQLKNRDSNSSNFNIQQQYKCNPGALSPLGHSGHPRKRW